MNAIIVDDCKLQLEIIASTMREACPEVEIIGKALTLEVAESMLFEKQPDLVLLDISMNGTKSFELLKKLDNCSFNFVPIFITGYGTASNQTQAIQFSDIDFILKPVDKTRLRRAVNKAKESIEQNITKEPLNALNQSVQTPDNPIVLMQLCQGKVKRVNLTDIAYLKAADTTTEVYLKNETKPLKANNLLKFFNDDMLKDMPFFKIHKSYIINLKLIQELQKSDLKVILETTYKTKLTVSRRRWNDLETAYMTYKD
jgi:two-component system, LytTR family, response regulator